jgi:hypothetical protein
MPVSWQAPADPLVQGVDRLVAAVNRQEISPHSDACNADAGPAYRIVLDYPDGARMIIGETAGCRDVQVGSTDRLGGLAIWHTYLALLAKQRAHERPGRLPASSHPTCTTRHHQLPFTPLWDARVLRRARLCVLSEPGPGLALSRADVRLLRHDLLTMAPRSQRRAIRPRGCAPAAHRGYDVVAVDGWGDLVDIRGFCDIYLAVSPETADSGYVRELPATRRMIQRLARAAIH